jgi:hypothetical protein
MARKFRVQHWIACREAQFVAQEGWIHPYDILGVSYTHVVPADTEFPREIERLDLFARFVDGRGSREFEVEVVWVDGPAGRKDVDTYGPFTVFFRFDQHVRSYVFRLLNVPLPGAGRYRAHLWVVTARGRVMLATEFFEVLVQP